jgi:hypothetical protein
MTAAVLLGYGDDILFVLHRFTSVLHLEA